MVQSSMAICFFECLKISLLTSPRGIHHPKRTFQAFFPHFWFGLRSVSLRYILHVLLAFNEISIRAIDRRKRRKFHEIAANVE